MLGCVYLLGSLALIGGPGELEWIEAYPGCDFSRTSSYSYNY